MNPYRPIHPGEGWEYVESYRGVSFYSRRSPLDEKPFWEELFPIGYWFYLDYVRATRFEVNVYMDEQDYKALNFGYYVHEGLGPLIIPTNTTAATVDDNADDDEEDEEEQKDDDDRPDFLEFVRDNDTRFQ